ncbi:hypothetical protein NLJ89_g7733 [Agrocybe chaxingu]|uniref:Multifunctional tryptophan biosynthesis protein n=1 Tax=Agrocybe chaxingu TaxID=84603 RepID=A0A9W8MV63_9AGAR|nr:hypothetical protein NLJ89_g7733 [Agrocybe chaxingu]
MSGLASLTSCNQAPSDPESGSGSGKKETILQKIYAQRARDVEKAKSTPGTTPADLEAQLTMNLAPPLIDVVERLRRNPSTSSHNSQSAPTPSLMAEIKRASPSKGPIAPDTNAAAQALTYALAGASLISVLTEPTWFLGSLTDMCLVRQTLSTLPDRPAVLRKDFILAEYQIDEARLWGADCVLLIVAMLDDDRLKALYEHSRKRGMEPLVEVNTEEEMARALTLGARLIGVNNRNLHSFDVDMGTTSRLSNMLAAHPSTILCALSGISSPESVTAYAKEGVRGVLIGESLMRAPDPAAFIQTLFNWPARSYVGLEPLLTKLPWVKISGAATQEEALFFMAAGAELIGLVFDTADPRCIEGATRVPNRPSPTSTENAPWFTMQAHRLVTNARTPLLVGVFKNQPLSTILHTVYNSQLDLVELTGSEPLEWALQIPTPVIRRVNVDEVPCSDIRELLRPGLHAFVSLSGSFNTNWRAVRAALDHGEVPGWAMPIINRAEHAQHLELAYEVGSESAADGKGQAEGAVDPVQWALQFEYKGEGKDKESSLEEFSRMIKQTKKMLK